MARAKATGGNTPLLEWIAAAIGLALILVVVTVIGREALREQKPEPPSIVIKIISIAPSAAGYVVAFEAINRANETAAALEIQATLRDGKAVVEESAATMNYVPGHGRTSGGVFFTHDPRRYALAVRATGFQNP